MGSTSDMRRLCWITSALMLASAGAVAGCSGGGSRAGDGTASPLSAVVGQGGTAQPVVERGGGDWTGPPPEPADVEAAYTTLVECLTDAGLSGTLRFDLSISTALIQNIALGRTEAEARDAQDRLERCLEPFDTTLSAYMITHPPTDAERRTIRDGIRACADEYFPGKVGSDLGYDETVTAYEVLLAASSLQDPRECADEAKAGPKRAFGGQ